MASTLDLLERLNRYAVEYVLVGGVAAVVHGSQLVTGDVDICAPLDRLSKGARDSHHCPYKSGDSGDCPPSLLW
jgi:hypothetical protein